MTEHDSPTGSQQPNSNSEITGSAPMSPAEKVRQQMERLRAQRASGGTQIDPTIPPPPITRPIISGPSLLDIAAQTSTDAARARAEELDRQAAALQASRLIPDQPSQPSPPAEPSSRFSVGRVFGGLFGGSGSGSGGGGGNGEPPGGQLSPDNEPDGPSFRERTLNPDNEPWKEGKSEAMRFLIEEVDVVPRRRNYANIRRAFEYLKGFYKKEAEWESGADDNEHRFKTIRTMIRSQKRNVEGKRETENWREQYINLMEEVNNARANVLQLEEVLKQSDQLPPDQSSQLENELTSAISKKVQTDSAYNKFTQGIQMVLNESYTIQSALAEKAIKLLPPEKSAEIKAKIDEEISEGAQTKDGRLITEDGTATDNQGNPLRAISRADREKQLALGEDLFVTTDVIEAVNGTPSLSKRELWNDVYGSLQIDGKSTRRIQEALNSYWEYIESSIQIPDPQRVIGDLQRIRALVARAHKDIGMEADEAEAIADNSDFWLTAVLNERFARVGDKGNRGALLAYATKDRFRARVRSLYSNEGIGDYDPAIFAMGTHLLGERGYSTLLVRPEGPRGEAIKETQMHGWFRDELRQQFAEELALYELKAEGDDEIDRMISIEEKRARIGWAMPKEEFRAMFIKHKREDFSDEEWKKRVKRVKEKESRRAQLYNAFMGNQAEMHVSRLQTKNGAGKQLAIQKEVGEGANKRVETTTVVSEGDYVLRRHAEYFIKYAILREMDKRGISPIALEKQLLSAPSKARTPRLTDPGMFGDVINRALNEIDQKGNDAEWTYDWTEYSTDDKGNLLDADGRLVSVTHKEPKIIKVHSITEKIEDIIEKDEIRILWDAYIANDGPLRAAYLDDDVADKVKANLKIRPDMRENFGTVDYLALLRKIMDPKLEIKNIGYREQEGRQAAEGLDFVSRIQYEASMAVFDHFFERMYSGSQGLGPFADSHIYGMKDGLLANRIENVKYVERMITVLPEIYAVPTSFACLRLDEFSHLSFMKNPKELNTLPEVFEDWSGELRAGEYNAMAMLRSFLLNSTEKDGGFKKGFFYEPVTSREKARGNNQALFLGVNPRTEAHGHDADSMIGAGLDLLKNLATLCELTTKMLTDERNFKIISPGNWVSGIMYDTLYDRLTLDNIDNLGRDQDPVAMYGAGIGLPVRQVLNASRTEGGTLRELIKEKMITSRGVTQKGNGHNRIQAAIKSPNSH